MCLFASASWLLRPRARSHSLALILTRSFSFALRQRLTAVKVESIWFFRQVANKFWIFHKLCFCSNRSLLRHLNELLTKSLALPQIFFFLFLFLLFFFFFLLYPIALAVCLLTLFQFSATFLCCWFS